MADLVKLFVGGFLLEMDEIELAKLFSNFTEIKTVKIVRDKVTRKCKGYAFLETTGQAGAEMAINTLNGKIMGDKELTVKVADEKPPITVSKPATYYVKVERPSGLIKKKRPRKQL
jgi:RNA recognition motif-containing protein